MKNSERIKNMAVTKRQAEQALRQIQQQFIGWLDPVETHLHGPKLIEGWDWLESDPTAWAIVWEGGPYNWAMLAQTGGITEFGTVIPAAKSWPAGTFAKPVTGWAIRIYEG